VCVCVLINTPDIQVKKKILFYYYESRILLHLTQFYSQYVACWVDLGM